MNWKTNRYTLIGMGLGAVLGLAFGVLVNALLLAVMVWTAAGICMGAIFDRRNRLEFN